MAPDAVELTVEAAWFIADTVGAGSFPWVLAITPPYRDLSERAAFTAGQIEELTRLGVISADTGRIDASVTEWIRAVCFPDRWIELRYVGNRSDRADMLRGYVARRDERTVVALRSAGLITFTALDTQDPSDLVPIVVAGLTNRVPARFAEFSLPARVGARADEQLRGGAELAGVLDYLGIPGSARPVVESVFSGPRTYVEVVAGQRREGVQATTEIGMAVIDTDNGRVLVSPAKAPDGEWISTFRPGTAFAIALALTDLTSTLPDGQWFPAVRLSRDFCTSDQGTDI
ncbi:MAG: ESX secretion-associated protein EspG [Mycobacterium sp.]